MAVLGLSLLAARSFAFDSVGLNFNNSSVPVMEATEVAGVLGYQQANWTTTNAKTGSMQDMTNALGGSTTMDIAWSSVASNWWKKDTAPAPGDDLMMQCWLDTKTVSGSTESTVSTITVSEIPYSTYAVVLYCDGGTTNNRVGRYTIKDTSGTTTLAGPIFNLDAANTNYEDSGYLQSTATTLAEATSAGNYIVFEGLSASEFMLECVGVTDSNPRAPVNAIQIVNAFTKKANSPVPTDNATLVPVDQVLSWDAPNDPNVAIVHGYRVFIDPNETKVIEGTAASSYVTEASLDLTQDLEYLTEYFWRVDADDELNDANSTRDFFVGDVWSFMTQPANLDPTIDVYQDVITAAELQPALLTAVVSDDDASILVSAEFTCADPNVTLLNPGGTLEAPTVEAVSNSDANPHIFVVTLTVEDSGGKTATADAEVRVYADRCQAAAHAPSWTGHLEYDSGALVDGVIVRDCMLNLEDFAGLALQWLEDKQMTVQENF